MLYHLYRLQEGALPLLEIAGRQVLLPTVEVSSSASITIEELEEVELGDFLLEVPRMLLSGLEERLAALIEERRRGLGWQNVIFCSKWPVHCFVHIGDDRSLQFTAFVNLSLAVSPMMPSNGDVPVREGVTVPMELVASSSVFPFLFRDLDLDLDLGGEHPEEFFTADRIRELEGLIAGCFSIGPPPEGG